MIEKSCRCGKSKKNFKMDIGPFYVDDCCLEAGYDEVGNKIKQDVNPDLLPTQEQLDAAALLKEDTSPEPEDPVLIDNGQGELRPATPEEVEKLNNMEIVQETNVTQNADGTLKTEDVPVTGETVAQKKAREKAEKKARKDAEKAAKKEAQAKS